MKASILQNYLDGTQEPSFHFLETYGDELGICIDWLKYGEKEPFYSPEETHLFATDYLNRIKELSPVGVYFLRSEEGGSSGIVLKISSFKFVYFPKIWSISSDVGSTGQGQLLAFYKLIKILQAECSYLLSSSFYCQERILNKEDFWNLFCGKLYPGTVIEFRENPWWDDFTDIYHTYAYAQDYEKMYGKEFIQAQKLIKHFLEKNRQKNDLNKNTFKDGLLHDFFARD